MDMIVCKCGHHFDRAGPAVTCEVCGTEHRAITTSDSANVKVTTEIVAVKLQGDRAVGMRVVGDSGRNISTDVLPGDQVASSIRARPRSNESNVPEVARILLEHLNRAGATWQGPEICANASAREERGVDFILRNGDISMDCQVVRPAHMKTALWSRIGRGATVETTETFADAAEELMKAVEQKRLRIPQRGRASITLVIDSIETPALVLQDVLSEFRHKYGDSASSAGFDGIWVVGATPNLTQQIA